MNGDKQYSGPEEEEKETKTEAFVEEEVAVAISDTVQSSIPEEVVEVQKEDVPSSKTEEESTSVSNTGDIPMDYRSRKALR